MTDNTTILGKSIFAGATEHLRDSNFEEYLCEGVIFVGDSLTKGTLEPPFPFDINVVRCSIWKYYCFRCSTDDSSIIRTGRICE